MVEPRRPDHLGLRSALSDRLLPVLVGAMCFLAALAIAGALGAATLAAHWQGDTASALTIQVPAPEVLDATGSGSRVTAVLAALQTAPGVSDAKRISTQDVTRLLTPWLGPDAGQLGLPIPAVITANWENAAPPDGLQTVLEKFAPGTLVATGASWAARVSALTSSLQDCAVALLCIVALVAAAMVAIATRSGLAQRRETVEIIHGLGALDSDIADRFAARATALTATGGIIGTLAALPVLFWLASLAAPFASLVPDNSALPSLPRALWAALPALPIAAAFIGWATAQLTVRGWLNNLA